MTSHTDLLYVYELTKNALNNIKDLEGKMKNVNKKKKTRRKHAGRKARKNRKSRKGTKKDRNRKK